MKRCAGLSEDELEWLRCSAALSPAVEQGRKLDAALADSTLSPMQHASQVAAMISELITAATVGLAVEEAEEAKHASAAPTAVAQQAAALALRRKLDAEVIALWEQLSAILTERASGGITAQEASQRATQACSAAEPASVRTLQLQSWELFDALQPATEWHAVVAPEGMVAAQGPLETAAAEQERAAEAARVLATARSRAARIVLAAALECARAAERKEAADAAASAARDREAQLADAKRAAAKARTRIRSHEAAALGASAQLQAERHEAIRLAQGRGRPSARLMSSPSASALPMDLDAE